MIFNRYKNLSLTNVNKFFLYIVYIFLISILSLVFTIFFIKKFGMVDESFNLILKDISFAHGPLIENIVNYGNFFQYIEGIKFYLAKTLFIPVLISGLALISTNIFFIIIFKNILFYSIYFFICLKYSTYFSLKLFNFITLLLIPIFIPYNLIVSLNFVYEDCVIAILLPCLYLLLISNIKKRYLYISLILFILYFVKTSMFLIVLCLPVFIIFFENNNKFKYLPIFFSISAIMIWGSYGVYKTGKFPFGSASSTYNSQVLSFSFNKNFASYYPLKSTDLIPVKWHPNHIKNEWDFYDYYKKLNNDYIKKNYLEFFKNNILKIKFILFNIHRDGAFPEKNGEFNNDIRPSLIINKVLFNSALFLLFYSLIKNFKSILRKDHFYFFILLSLNLPPHLIAWATSKHLVGITSVSIIYLFYNFFQKK